MRAAACARGIAGTRLPAAPPAEASAGGTDDDYLLLGVSGRFTQGQSRILLSFLG
jgi:hypothetical protein